MDSLHHRKEVIVNACPTCLAEEEIVGQLLLNCKVVQGLWSAVSNWFGCSWVLPHNIRGHFESWHMALCSNRGRVLLFNCEKLEGGGIWHLGG